MEPVLDRLVVELERPRELTAQTLRHLSAAHGVDREGAGAFVEDRLSHLEDDELDLALSAQFTPKLADQAVFAGLLGGEGVPAEVLPGWVERVANRPSTGHLVTSDGRVHGFTLKPVTIGRYVYRLRLDATVPDSTLKCVRSLVPEADRPRVLAIARRAVWNTPRRRELLEKFLTRAHSEVGGKPGDDEEFLALVETSEPEGIADTLARIPAWEQVARSQLSGADQPSPFFNERVQDLHGGGRDQRGANERLRQRKQAELEFLGRLRHLLGGAVA